MNKKRVNIIGAGFYGLTIAEQCANFDIEVNIFEKRSHIGGNAYTYFDEDTGINIHKYGTHIFHTNNEKVWDYVNQFSGFNQYIHMVQAVFQNGYFPIPVNLSTLSSFFGKRFTPREAQDFVEQLASRFQSLESPRNLYEKGIKTLGKDLFEAFFSNYTEKQWEVPAQLLPAGIINRIPVRYDFNPRYFTDRFQGIPDEGYTPLCEKMIESPNIKINFGVDFFDHRQEITKDALVVYTGPIDQYFDYKFGRLNWRTIDLEIETVETTDFQGNSVINYPELSYKFTRIHEFRHLHPERVPAKNQTVIAREYSRFAQGSDEPYYPVNTQEDRRKLEKYRKLDEFQSLDTIFGGRLGSYQYLDMHMAIASALTVFENRIRPAFKV